MSHRRAVTFVISICIVLTVLPTGARPALASTEGSANNFFGTGAGMGNTGTGVSFFGGLAGGSSNSGDANSFFGGSAGFANSTGHSNSFFGGGAGGNNTTGSNNSFFGRSAGLDNSTGTDNSFFGRSAGSNTTTGNDNAFFGTSAGLANTTGFGNAFFGRSAGQATTTGENNAFFGTSAGAANTAGFQNAFFGHFAGLNNIGPANAFFGQAAGALNTTGSTNAFFGKSAGNNNTTGQQNSFFGAFAGSFNTTESRNTFIGNSTRGANGITNATALGHSAIVSESDSLVLGSIEGLNSATSSVNVGIGTDSPTAPLHVVKTTPGGVAGSINQGAFVVNRTDGSPANIRFSNLNRSYLFQNNPTNQVFSIINETAGNTPVSIFPDAGSNAFVVRSGRWGLGVGAPAVGRAIDTNTGAFLSTAGVWTDASSRSLKSDIADLSVEDAISVLRALDAKTFRYKKAPGDTHLGFIAEDVPDLVATAGRNGLSPMDLVTVAIRVLQAKDAENSSLAKRVAALEASID